MINRDPLRIIQLGILVPIFIEGSIRTAGRDPKACGEFPGAIENVTATVIANNKKTRSEFGDMLFTHFGISGPIILKLSSTVIEHLNKKEPVTISINLKPALDEKKLDARLVREFSANSRRALSNVMRNLLPKKLVPIILKISGVMSEKQCGRIAVVEREKILQALTDFRLEVTKARPIAEAIITRGGIPLKEIEPFTMESKKVQGLYFCGEVIDIDGMTGGITFRQPSPPPTSSLTIIKVNFP